MVSKIQSIDKLRYTGTGCEHGQTMINVLKTVCAPTLQKLASQVEKDRVQQVKSWIWKAQHVEEWIDRADGVLIEAQAEERIAEQRRKAQTTITYSQWLETALKKGSKTAHLWTTQTATSVHPMDYQNSTTPQQSMLARTKEWGVTGRIGTWRHAISYCAKCTSLDCKLYPLLHAVGRQTHYCTRSQA